MEQLASGIFKKWVPVWAIRICIFLLLLPNLLLFTVSTASIPAACGYYGIDPSNANYSLIVLYAALVSFFPLERRFSAYFVPKDYMIISILLEIGSSFGAYCAKDFTVLLIFRFLQGIANITLVAICISLIFNHLKTERSREIGYSVVYGTLLCITPVTIALTAPFLDNINYNVLYLIITYAFIPGAILAVLIMSRQRLIRKIPLFQLDWQSFVIYTTALMSLTYLLIYGQQLNWFTNPKINVAFLIFTMTLLLYILRQLHLKRPYLNLSIFRFPAYRKGVALILILYLARGAFNFTTIYFTQVLGMNPDHLGEILLLNIMGVVAGTLVSSRMMIFKRSFYIIWIIGLTILMLHYVSMIFLFSAQANATVFFIPLVIQGIGTGMLLTPIIVYMVTSVPQEFAATASATAVSVRLIGTSISIAVINYFQLYDSAIHYDRFQVNLSPVSLPLTERLLYFQHLLVRRGLDPGKSAIGGRRLLKNALDQQTFLRTAIDYYLLIAFLLLITIIALAILPRLKVKKVTIDPVAAIPV